LKIKFNCKIKKRVNSTINKRLTGLAAAATSVMLACVDVRCFIRFELLEADVDNVFFPGHSVNGT